ncbi:8621_t:CDS:2, partial [Racocetra persica]
KRYNEIIDQIEDEAIQNQDEALDKSQLGLINPQNSNDNDRLDLLQEHILTCLDLTKASQQLIFPEEDLEFKEIKEEEKDKKGNAIKIAEQIA